MSEESQDKDQLSDVWQPQGKEGSFRKRASNSKVLGNVCLEQKHKEIMEALCTTSEK